MSAIAGLSRVAAGSTQWVGRALRKHESRNTGISIRNIKSAVCNHGSAACRGGAGSVGYRAERRLVAGVVFAVLFHPVAECYFVHAEFPCNLGDRA